jgi:hypothetical protein
MVEQKWHPGLSRSRSEGGPSYPDGQSLAGEHLKDSSIGGLSFEPPVDLSADTGVRVRRSRITSSGAVGQPAIQYGRIVHATPLEFGCTHGRQVATILTQSSVQTVVFA